MLFLTKPQIFGEKRARFASVGVRHDNLYVMVATIQIKFVTSNQPVRLLTWFLLYKQLCLFQ